MLTSMPKLVSQQAEKLGVLRKLALLSNALYAHPP